MHIHACTEDYAYACSTNPDTGQPEPWTAYLYLNKTNSSNGLNQGTGTGGRLIIVWAVRLHPLACSQLALATCHSPAPCSDCISTSST